LTKWNASSDLLEQSLQELEMQGVVTISEQGVVAATPVSRWKAARES
jgi:adenine/guanine phosphoribosyltransferase-like PRPP-binding protein